MTAPLVVVGFMQDDVKMDIILGLINHLGRHLSCDPFHLSITLRLATPLMI